MSDFYVHTNALCETENVGRGTRIWAFVHILPGAVIGSDCNICDFVFIENEVRIGDRVTIKSGVQIWNNIDIQDDVFIGPNVTFTNDKYPRSKNYENLGIKTTVKSNATVGANSTILPGVTIGSYAMVGAGSVVTHDIPDFALVYGNPAQVRSDIRDKPDFRMNL